MKRLKKSDYEVDAETAAKMLLGKWLCRRLADGTVNRARIIETEAYCGEEDTACHAHCGKTERNAPMFEAGGVAYIYLCYGMHNLLNVVTGAKDYPEAVLIRGVEDHIWPGRVTKFLQIDRSLNRETLHAQCLNGNTVRDLRACEVANVPTQAAQPKISRNAPCPCGSGKKHKLCCGRGK